MFPVSVSAESRPKTPTHSHACQNITAKVNNVYNLNSEHRLSDSDNSDLQPREFRLNDISGKVTISSQDNKFNAIDNNIIINVNDSIRTEASSCCNIIFDRESYFKLGENSSLTLVSSDPENTRIKFSDGSGWAYISSPPSESGLRLELKYATLRIAGTIFAFEEKKDISTVWMFTGYAMFSSGITGEEHAVSAGQRISFDKDGRFHSEYINVNQNIGKWGIPASVIREDSGYGWVPGFIYILICFAVITFSIILYSYFSKKRRKKKAISETAPKENHCVYCGKKLNFDDIFCKNCGAVVKRKSNSNNTKDTHIAKSCKK